MITDKGVMCDATNLQSGKPDGPPCPRKAVVEVVKRCGDSTFQMHYCRKHMTKRRMTDAGVVEVVSVKLIEDDYVQEELTWAKEHASA